jgi:hypothetical protein
LIPFLLDRLSLQLINSIFPEKNNVDLGVNIAGDLEDLKKNLDKYKASTKGGGEFDDVDIHQLDWVEDNRKVKAFFIYESSL